MLYCLLVYEILQFVFHLLHSFTVNTADLSKYNICWAGKAYDINTCVYTIPVPLVPFYQHYKTYVPGRSVRPKILDRIARLASWNFPTNDNTIQYIHNMSHDLWSVPIRSLWVPTTRMGDDGALAWILSNHGDIVANSSSPLLRS